MSPDTPGALLCGRKPVFDDRFVKCMPNPVCQYAIVSMPEMLSVRRGKSDGGGAILGAHDFGQSHHALRACDIICFENRFDLDIIKTQGP